MDYGRETPLVTPKSNAGRKNRFFRPVCGVTPGRQLYADFYSGILRLYYPQYFLSSVRYCTASATCSSPMVSTPSRSHIVLATFNIRV